jgi:asparagine synthase (glutamine-hydrolysing)
LDAFDERGERCLREMLGDFSVAIYDPPSHRLLAARDAFGVKTLFLAQRGRYLILSSHLEPVHDGEKLDDEFVAAFLLGSDPGPERTIWADCRAVAHGSILTVEDGKVSADRFWTPHDFQPRSGGSERQQVEQFGELFRAAVRQRIQPDRSTWAELSGGLDSSSVVCTAQELVAKGDITYGISGTVSIVDRLGGGDESRYSRLVVERHQTRNKVIEDPWAWQDDGRGPSRTDEPRAHYPYYARDRQLHETVTGEGGAVLLTGIGSDHYLYGNRLIFADQLAQGHVLSCIRQLATWTIAERKSFWAAVVRDLAVPLLPAFAQPWLAAPWDRVPSWINPAFARRTALPSRLYMQRTWAAPRGHKFARRVADDISELTHWLPRGPSGSLLELRHPFLYRPLVEFGLSLPVAMRMRPAVPKWILREALRGTLPEPIRIRGGKGAIDSRFVWALTRERARVDALTRNARLVQEGYVDQKALLEVIRRARAGNCEIVVPLLCTLALETWLSVSSGRWSTASPLAASRDSRSPDIRSLREEVTSHDEEVLRCSERL